MNVLMTPMQEITVAQQSGVQPDNMPAINPVRKLEGDFLSNGVNLLGNIYSGILKFDSLLNNNNAATIDRESDQSEIHSREDSLMTDALLFALLENPTMADTNDKQTTSSGQLSVEATLSGRDRLVPRDPHRVATDNGQRATEYIAQTDFQTTELSTSNKPCTGETLVLGKLGELPDINAHVKGQKLELSLKDMVTRWPELPVCPTGRKVVDEIKDFSNVKVFKNHPDNLVESSLRLAKIENANINAPVKSQRPELYLDNMTGLDFLKGHNNAEELYLRRVIRIIDGTQVTEDSVKLEDSQTTGLSTSNKPRIGETLVLGKLGELPDINAHVKGQRLELSLKDMVTRWPELPVCPTGRKVVDEIKDFSNVKVFKNHADNLVESSLRLAKIKNADLTSSSNITYGSHKTGDNPFSEIVTKPSGFTELLDKIVYVVKSNNRLNVSIEHDSLGKLNINLTMERGILNVHINTSERAIRELIGNNLQYIVDSLMEDGVSIGGFSVTLKNQKDNRGNTFIGNTPIKGVTKAPDVNSSTGLVNIFV